MSMAKGAHEWFRAYGIKCVNHIPYNTLYIRAITCFRYLHSTESGDADLRKSQVYPMTFALQASDRV